MRTLSDYAKPNSLIYIATKGDGFVDLPPLMKNVKPIPDGHFSVFHNFTFDGMTNGQDIRLDDNFDLNQTRQEVKTFLNSLKDISEVFDFLLYLPGGSLFEKGTLADFKAYFQVSLR